MNAIVALVHFCDAEGPSVIFCTQAFHDSSSGDLDKSHSDSNGRHSPLSNYESVKDNNRKDRTAPSTCASCAFLLPPWDDKNYLSPKDRADFKGFRTVDDENPSVTYIGSRYPQHQKLYAAVRQACVRSLSCEFCQGREGPVLFGDEKDGYILSYMFKIVDSQARGSQRFYSFIFLMTDRVYLVASWPFLVSKFRILVTTIQKKANQIFEKEKVARERQDDSRPSPAPVTSPDLFLRRRANQPLRSLVDLLGSKDLFVQLHANFSWILKASGRRLQERQIRGETILSDNKKLCEQNISDTEDPSRLDFRIKSIKHLQTIMGTKDFRKLAYNFVRGNQLVIQGSDRKLVESIISVVKDLIPRKCCSIIEYENQYRGITSCNLLGLSASTKIPEGIDKSTFCLLDTSSNTLNENPANFQFQLQFGMEEEYQGGQNIKDLVAKSPPSNLFMDQLDDILKTPLTPDLMEMRIMIFKEQWLSKAKQFVKIGIGASMADSNNVATSMPNAKQKEFLKLLDVDVGDLPIIRFWINLT